MAEWYERGGGGWSAEDRQAARAWLAARWAAVTGNSTLAPLTYPAGAPAADVLDEVVQGRGYSGSRSADAFTAYVALHVRSHVLLANPPDTWVAAVMGWLQDVHAVAFQRLTIAACSIAKVPSAEVGGLVVLFCHRDLEGVLGGYDRDELFWPYLITSFQNFVRRQEKATRRWEEVTTQWDPSSRRDEQLRAADSEDEDAERASEDAERRIQREILRELQNLRREEIERHGGARADGCAACLGLEVLRRAYFEPRRADHAVIAADLGISVGNCRVLLTRALHRVRERVARYPIAVEAYGHGWRVHANDVALWDTVIRIECEPRDLARPDMQQLTLRKGMNRSIDVITLRTTPFETTRPTAVVFGERDCRAGEVANGAIYLNQVRLAARGSGRETHVWIVVPPRRPATGRVELIVSTPDAVAAIAVGQVRGPSPLRCEVSARETVVPVEIATALRPGPGRVVAEPETMVGGAADRARASVTLGARIAAATPGGRAEAVLAIAPPAGAPAPQLTSSDPEHLSIGKPRRREQSAIFDAALKPAAVPETRVVVLLATGGGQEASGPVIVVPPPIVAIRLSDDRLRAGESITGSVEVKCPVVAPAGASVTLSSSHGGIVFEPPRPIIAAGATHGSFTCRAVTEARQGVASIVAGVNDSSVSADLQVIANGIKAVTFEPHIVRGGATAIGTVLCHHPLGDAITIHVSSVDGLADVGPVTLAIPKNAAGATFSVNTRPVKRAATVEIVAVGLGGRVSGRLRLTP